MKICSISFLRSFQNDKSIKMENKSMAGILELVAFVSCAIEFNIQT